MSKRCIACEGLGDYGPCVEHGTGQFYKLKPIPQSAIVATTTPDPPWVPIPPPATPDVPVNDACMQRIADCFLAAPHSHRGYGTLEFEQQPAAPKLGAGEADEIVMYIIVRKDLKMSPGKTAAQVGHAVHLTVVAQCTINNPSFISWHFGSYAKIVLAIEDLEKFEQLRLQLRANGIGHHLVIDQGRTELDPDTKTCMALVPMPKSIAAQYVGHLPLLR